MKDSSLGSLQTQLHQKRQNSVLLEYFDNEVNKRRLAKPGSMTLRGKNSGLSDGNTVLNEIFMMYPMDQMDGVSRDNKTLHPISFHDAGDSIGIPYLKQKTKAILLDTFSKLNFQSWGVYTLQLPFYLLATPSSKIDAVTKAIDNNKSLEKMLVGIPQTTDLFFSSSSPNVKPGVTVRLQQSQKSQKKLFTMDSQNCHLENESSENIDDKNHIDCFISNRGGYRNESNEDQNAVNSEKCNSTNNNNNRNESGGNNNGDKNNNWHGVSHVSPQARQVSQALIEKLQEIYKNIVKQETELREKCSHFSISHTTNPKNIWIVYRLNTELIDNYFMFITTALSPAQPEADLLIGQEIVEVYRIERRLWIYGTIIFLDVLKKFSNIVDSEACCQFIIHVFITISNMLGSIPLAYHIVWLERLGDLSRMAIALYPSGFVDWKLSAEHWYREALKYKFGHGKLYYHISTVQQNTLAAFVNLGKSVFCHDMFIPSRQYMQLVIANIYQRAIADRNSSCNRNLQLIEYLKHTEVMLLPSFEENMELQNVVLTFFEHKFGVNSSGGFFDPNLIFLQDSERLRYFFHHSSLYAESHILQLVGFGDPKNPFALLFELPKHLKERKWLKERRMSKLNSSNHSDMSLGDIDFENPLNFFETIDSTKVGYIFPENINIWRLSLNYINTTKIKCSMTVLRKFLNGPLLTALPHFLPWTYFLTAVGLRITKFQNEEAKRFWISFLRHIFPWETITTFLNVLILFMKCNECFKFLIDKSFASYYDLTLVELLSYFSENEELSEVWSCWGSLWFYTISDKHSSNYTDIKSTGVVNDMFLDAPIDGIIYDHEDESGEKFWKRCARIILIYSAITRELSFGLLQVGKGQDWMSMVFKFQEPPDEWRELYLGNFSGMDDVFENLSAVNLDIQAVPYKSMVPNVDICSLKGYRTLMPDYYCFNRYGDSIAGSIYTSARTEGSGLQNCKDLIDRGVLENGQLFSNARNDYIGAIDREEKPILDQFLRNSYNNCSHQEISLPYGDLQHFTDTHVTYFVLDATTWLRHFGHVYILASQNLLKFAICLTTFQELRFLRKSKDEGVLVAATRAVIIVRQLYQKQKLLPLRFSGNIAVHLEEHLEIKEQMTWHTHIDEFVIETIYRAQAKFNQLDSEARAANKHKFKLTDNDKFNFISLVTDDMNMCGKAKAQNIRAFSTRFIFSICNVLRERGKLCTK